MAREAGAGAIGRVRRRTGALAEGGSLTATMLTRRSRAADPMPAQESMGSEVGTATR